MMMAMMLMSNKIKDDDGGVSNKVRRSMMPISGGGVQEKPAKILVQVCQALVF